MSAPGDRPAAAGRRRDERRPEHLRHLVRRRRRGLEPGPSPPTNPMFSHGARAALLRSRTAAAAALRRRRRRLVVAVVRVARAGERRRRVVNAQLELLNGKLVARGGPPRGRSSAASSTTGRAPSPGGRQGVQARRRLDVVVARAAAPRRECRRATPARLLRPPPLRGGRPALRGARAVRRWSAPRPLPRRAYPRAARPSVFRAGGGGRRPLPPARLRQRPAPPRAPAAPRRRSEAPRLPPNVVAPSALGRRRVEARATHRLGARHRRGELRPQGSAGVSASTAPPGGPSEKNSGGSSEDDDASAASTRARSAAASPWLDAPKELARSTESPVSSSARIVLRIGRPLTRPSWRGSRRRRRARSPPPTSGARRAPRVDGRGGGAAPRRRRRLRVMRPFKEHASDGVRALANRSSAPRQSGAPPRRASSTTPRACSASSRPPPRAAPRSTRRAATPRTRRPWTTCRRPTSRAPSASRRSPTMFLTRTVAWLGSFPPRAGAAEHLPPCCISPSATGGHNPACFYCHRVRS